MAVSSVAKSSGIASPAGHPPAGAPGRPRGPGPPRGPRAGRAPPQPLQPRPPPEGAVGGTGVEVQQVAEGLGGGPDLAAVVVSPRERLEDRALARLEPPGPF